MGYGLGCELCLVGKKLMWNCLYWSDINCTN